jgi:cyclohexa-1,5-dienecarbonyl-CoA hydratase
MEYTRLELSATSPTARIVLSHGKQNVIDIKMMQELVTALDEVERDPAISTVLIAGHGEHFSSGVDIPSHARDRANEMLMNFHSAIRRLVKTPKVTIAAVRGYCLGGGAELAMVCDIVLTTESAHWGFPEIQLGCFPPVAASALAAIVGQKRAAELVLTGCTFDGREAEQIGLATRAVAADKLKEAVVDFEGRLTALSPTALAHAKRTLAPWSTDSFESSLARAEEIYLKQLIQTHDAQEGIAAWIERRKPKWTGK